MLAEVRIPDTWWITSRAVCAMSRPCRRAGFGPDANLYRADIPQGDIWPPATLVRMANEEILDGIACG